jgi:hypothetical protein
VASESFDLPNQALGSFRLHCKSGALPPCIWIDSAPGLFLMECVLLLLVEQGISRICTGRLLLLLLLLSTLLLMLVVAALLVLVLVAAAVGGR